MPGTADGENREMDEMMDMGNEMRMGMGISDLAQMEGFHGCGVHD